MTDTILVVEGLMLDSAARRLKAVAWIEFTFISLLNGRPAQHPEEFMNQFQPLCVDGIFDAERFSARVEALKAQYRSRSGA